MKIIVYRILGNDLPPRHSETQTGDNLEFLLQNEPDLGVGVERRFLLNRIVDPNKLTGLKDLIGSAGLECDEIPFVSEIYAGLTTRDAKFRYLTNVNEARNQAVRLGVHQRLADYVLPLDGGCIFRSDGWNDFVHLVARDQPKYVAIPMWRMKRFEDFESYPECLYEEFRFGRSRSGWKLSATEPQLAFSKAYDCLFNPQLKYGQVDKVELLWRLGLPGIWDMWGPKERYYSTQAYQSSAFGQVPLAGYVCRMPSGNPEADRNNQVRGAARASAESALLARVKELTGI